MTQNCAVCGRPLPELSADQVLGGGTTTTDVRHVVQTPKGPKVAPPGDAGELAASGRLAWQPSARGRFRSPNREDSVELYMTITR